MPRPTTKNELLEAAHSQYSKLLTLISSMSEGMKHGEFTFGAGVKHTAPHWRRDKNLRDVLAHLHAWHNMLLEFVAANSSGQPRLFLPAPYTWKTTPALNESIRNTYQDYRLEDIQELLDASHAGVLALIHKHSHEELFTKQHFPWTGTTSLGSYCASATSSHYDWAIKKLRAYVT